VAAIYVSTLSIELPRYKSQHGCRRAPASSPLSGRRSLPPRTRPGWPIEGDWPYLWIDATYVKVRQPVASCRSPSLSPLASMPMASERASGYDDDARFADWQCRLQISQYQARW
jgi:hypothetical protein